MQARPMIYALPLRCAHVVAILFRKFLFFRTDVFREIGLFDERFFMYPEDIDISRRVLSRFESQFLPHAEVTLTPMRLHRRRAYACSIYTWLI